MQLSELTFEHFEPHIGQVFLIRYDPDQTLETTLVKVARLGSEPPSDKPPKRRWAFSLVFQGPMSPVLSQRIYTVEHAALGTLEMFLVPLGPDSDQQGMHYEAIFA